MSYPTFDTAEIVARLEESLATLQWAASNIPEEYSHKLPDFYAANDWSAAMNIGHLVIYDEAVSAPTLEAMATGGVLVGPGSPLTPGESWFYNDSVALSEQPIAERLGRLAKARERNISLVDGERQPGSKDDERRVTSRECLKGALVSVFAT